ncbi:MAG: hypothetical protein ACRERD_14285 [Candidatus Binatia bacterium]
MPEQAGLAVQPPRDGRYGVSHVRRGARPACLSNALLLKGRHLDESQRAIAHYLRQHDGSSDAVFLASELKLRAERKLGELLAELPKQHGARPPDAGLHHETPTLNDAGVSKIQSHRWQTIATLPFW